MNEMMRPDLGVALLHHHGDYDTQYLSKRPHSAELDQIADSLMNDSLNLTLKDFRHYGYRPNCRVAIYDACYNAAFQHDDCIANEYIFQPGKTVVGIGGTVNVLQDKWPDRYLGLLDKGLPVGRLVQLSPELETHVVGDPTYTFASEKADGRSADEQCLAMLEKGERLGDKQLLLALQTAPLALVRLQAFMLLQERNSPLLADAIRVAATDNFELLQRFAVNALQRCGDPQLAPVLARLLATNNTSARVAFNAVEAVQFLPEEAITAAVSHALDSIAPYVTWPDEYCQQRAQRTASYAQRWADDVHQLTEGKMSERRRLVQADRMKIYLPAYLAPEVAAYAERCGDPQLQVELLSTLGWHRLAYTHREVEAVVERMSLNAALPEAVRHEAEKTLKRLRD